jgi:hypothetical protein
VRRISIAARQAARYSVDFRSSRGTLSLNVAAARRSCATEVGSHVQYVFAEALFFIDSFGYFGLFVGTGGGEPFDH